MPKRRPMDDIGHFRQLNDALIGAIRHLYGAVDHFNLAMNEADKRLEAERRTKNERAMLEAIRTEAETLRKRTLDLLDVLYAEGQKKRKR